MTCLLCAGAAATRRMSDCAFQPRLEAYHDGRLAPDARAAVERHVTGCAACAAHLAWLREVSASLAHARPNPITADERRRLHAALNEAIDAGETEPYPLSLSRTAAALAAVAASILLVSWVWLDELPAATPRGTVQAVAAAEVPAWERVAINLRIDPMPSYPGGETYLADARLADWMLEGLAGTGGSAIDESR